MAVLQLLLFFFSSLGFVEIRQGITILNNYINWERKL